MRPVYIYEKSMASEKCCYFGETLLFWGVDPREISMFKCTQVDVEEERILNVDDEFPSRDEEQSLEHWILKSWLHQTELNLNPNPNPFPSIYFLF